MKKLRYFFDTEFIEDGKTIDLISIGILCQDGRSYYAISNEFSAGKASQWVRDNVLAKLEPDSQLPRKRRRTISREIVEFTAGTKPEFWGYYADYDWVVLCQLFGTMMELPKEWPMMCMDIKQYCVQLGNPILPESGKGEHNALADALWNLEAYSFLKNLSRDFAIPVSGS